MPLDKRVTFFSRFGQWLDFCCAVCLVLVIIAAASQKLITAKAAPDTREAR
jgi:hypothetical protein